jgi:hypothetical protein
MSLPILGTSTCVSWLDVDKFKWEGRALDSFVFEVDARGNAVGVQILGLRVEMKRNNRADGRCLLLLRTAGLGNCLFDTRFL